MFFFIIFYSFVFIYHIFCTCVVNVKMLLLTACEVLRENTSLIDFVNILVPLFPKSLFASEQLTRIIHFSVIQICCQSVIHICQVDLFINTPEPTMPSIYYSSQHKNCNKRELTIMGFYPLVNRFRLSSHTLFNSVYFCLKGLKKMYSFFLGFVPFLCICCAVFFLQNVIHAFIGIFRFWVFPITNHKIHCSCDLMIPL